MVSLGDLGHLGLGQHVNALESMRVMSTARPAPPSLAASVLVISMTVTSRLAGDRSLTNGAAVIGRLTTDGCRPR